jgi:tetratricopeptide (TPR) repeat protein
MPEEIEHRNVVPRLGAAALCGLLALVPLLAVGCGEPERPGREAAAADAEWAWLQRAKENLDRKRAELAAAKSPPPALVREEDALSEELNRRLVAFLNARPPLEGHPLTARQQGALHMKSDEDIRLAHEAIDQGGDHQRAIEIYESALAVDPDNQRLRQELAQAERVRYITAERFAQVQKGMRQEEVRGLLGQPNPHNVRDYPQRGVSAWFYQKDGSGSAAAVWFEKKGGGLVVYSTDFAAVKAPRPAGPPARAPLGADSAPPHAAAP